MSSSSSLAQLRLMRGVVANQQAGRSWPAPELSIEEVDAATRVKGGCLGLRALLGGVLEKDAGYVELVVTLVSEGEAGAAVAAPRVRVLL